MPSRFHHTLGKGKKKIETIFFFFERVIYTSNGVKKANKGKDLVRELVSFVVSFAETRPPSLSQPKNRAEEEIFFPLSVLVLMW